MIKDFLIMKREHPYGKAPLFLGKFDQKNFQKLQKVFRGFFCYPYIG
jgi:hypothetical protein